MSLVARIFRKISLSKVFSEYLLLKKSKSTPSLENSNRFYPPTVSPYKNEPTRDKFDIVEHQGSGEGVVAKAAFQAGDLVFRFSGTLLDFQTLFTLQKQKGVYIEDPYFMGKILHSCDPNTFVDMRTREFWASKDIQPGEFITMDYELTEDELYRSFYCQCGSPVCRGKIAGKLARLNE